MKCRHDYKRTLFLAEYLRIYQAEMGGPCSFAAGRWANEQIAATCTECGVWIPLGPANDTAEALVEVRAAEIAEVASISGQPSTCGTADEGVECEECGWIDRHYGIDSDGSERGGWHAGHLAHAIVNHDDEQSTATDRLVEVCARTYAEERAASDGESTP